ncbi:ASCC2 [Bugula neritina]|uniref:ASCC2 n=1 Tax=Bugula neritina TaxID=10212 RepID=A0A7J7JTX1_BUGNE|nr:ASCC2 [Bugula neritina]
MLLDCINKEKMDPLDKRKIIHDGQAVPAIDSYWVKDISFLPFSLLGPSNTKEQIDDWLNATDLLLDDLQLLLHEPCHVFWSHLIFDESLRTSLDSFLKLMPRHFDGEVTETVIHKQVQKLYQAYFKVFIRMTTCKESSSDYITPEVFGIILYENYILDIPKLMDMCIIFSPSNGSLLRKMIDNVFKHQPKYLDDVLAAALSIINMFEKLMEKLTDNKLTVPRGLIAPNPETSTAQADIVDLCLYSSDICHSVNAFLQHCPPACLAFHNPSFYKVLSNYYEDVLHCLLIQLESSHICESDQLKMYDRLNTAQEECVSLFRQVLFAATLEQANTHSEKCDLLIQEFYDILTEHLGEYRFIGHYSLKYPFIEDIEYINSINSKSDQTRQQFILDGLSLAIEVFLEQQNAADKDTTQNEIASANGSVDPSETLEDTASAAEAMVKPSIPSQLQSILDMFPDYGEGFIQMCLDHYKSADHVINALLENSLPPFLSTLDRTLAIPLQDETLLTSRKNVFDNDEFDVFRSRRIDQSKIHKGKRMMLVFYRANVLKTEDGAFKDKIKELVINCEELSMADNSATNGAYLVAEADMYDDEYDDTYDANEVGADDADEAQELMGRKLVVPVALGGSGLVEQADDNENDSKGAAYPTKTVTEKPKYDVKGRAKGQGQTAEVIKNRNFKTAHKARGANHNRKAGARSKMSKGMF